MPGSIDRQAVRAWLEENCPPHMRTPMPDDEVVHGGFKQAIKHPDSQVWLERMVAKGWTVPMWPKAYGGDDLDQSEYLILIEEMRRINARPPLLGMGVSMIGPTLLEYGTPEQKDRFLPDIATGKTRWCQGYSEPGAGSDLAGLQTRAVREGDEYVINGSKIWTSGAHSADWMFCLVRTNTEVQKQRGISFVLIDMTSPGVTVKPITLIDGASHFCQVFFDNVRTPVDQLVGRENDGWTVGKRLLQHERSGMQALLGADNDRTRTGVPLKALAQASYELDPALREAVVHHEMNAAALNLTRRRVTQESDAGTPGAATSIFKLRWAQQAKEHMELQLRARGTSGLGWEDATFDSEALTKGRLWLESKAASIAGGSDEVQRNIIAKRVLDLPDS